MTTRILAGDCRDVLATLPDKSVQMCVTSPPYFGLRSYLPDSHDHKQHEIGAEPTVQEYVSNLVAVFREVWRVLKDDGVLWVNLGDSYATSNDGSKPHTGMRVQPSNEISKSRPKRADGLRPKSLIGVPWRVAFALQDDGWILRSDVIWHKPNPMPESVTDRPTKAHEYLFLLAKQPRYYYDAAAISEHAEGTPGTVRSDQARKMNATPLYQSNRGGRTQEPVKQGAMGIPDSGKRNKRSVWTVTTQPFSGSHFATFPPKLIEPCILAGSREGDTVLDPFGGSGTTGMVADRLGRHSILIDLNPANVALAKERVTNDAPLFADVALG